MKREQTKLASPHFIVSTDPMRVITVPNTLNGESGLVCLPVGNRRSLENLDIHTLLAKADPYRRLPDFMSIPEFVQAQPELCDPPQACD
jgi:hypothetical protein